MVWYGILDLHLMVYQSQNKLADYCKIQIFQQAILRRKNKTCAILWILPTSYQFMALSTVHGSHAISSEAYESIPAF